MPPKRRTLDEARAGLTAAAKKLHADGEPDLAGFVEYALTDQYFFAIRDANSAGNLAISSTERIRDFFQQKSKAAGRTLTKDADTALREFSEGRFVPRKPTKAQYGTAKDVKNINVRPDAELRAQAEARCKELAEELGWKPAITNVIKQYLEFLYGLPRAE